MKIKILDSIILEIETNSEKIKEFFLKIYPNEKESTEKPAIIIKSKDIVQKVFKFPQRICNIENKLIYLRDANKKVAKINIQKTPLTIEFEKDFHLEFLLFNILEPLYILLKSQKKEGIFFHGSIINIKGQNIVLLGESETGKSSIILKNLLKKEGKLISDETSYIDKNLNAIPYTRSIYIYSRNFKDIPQLYNKIFKNRKENIKYKIKEKISDKLPLKILSIKNQEKLKRKFLFPIMVDPKKIGNIQKEKKKIDKIIILKKGEKKESIKEILLDNLISLCIERDLIYYALPYYDQKYKTKNFQSIFSNYKNQIKKIKTKIKVIEIDKTKDINELNNKIINY